MRNRYFNYYYFFIDRETEAGLEKSDGSKQHWRVSFPSSPSCPRVAVPGDGTERCSGSSIPQRSPRWLPAQLGDAQTSSIPPSTAVGGWGVFLPPFGVLSSCAHPESSVQHQMGPGVSCWIN